MQKILTVVFSLGKGGTERAAQNFALGYKEIGCESRILVTKLDGTRRKKIEANSIPIYFLNKFIDCSNIEKWKPDVIHIHNHGISTEEFQKIKSICTKAKYIETNVFSSPSPWAEENHISYQLSKWCQWLFKKNSKISLRTAIVPNPIICKDFELSTELKENLNKIKRSKLKIPITAFVIGRIGQEHIANWSEITIEIFNELHIRGYNPYLLLISPPSEIKKIINKSFKKENIIVVGPIEDDNELRNYYACMDLFLHCASAGETFGYVNTEAILSRVPVVTLATPWGGGNSQIEVVKNGVSGFIYHKKKDGINIIEKFIKKEIKLNSNEAIKDIYERYDYIKIAEKSIACIKGENNEKVTINDILKMMKNSHGNVNIFTLIMLSLGLNKFTIYTAGYKKFSIMVILKNRIKDKLLKLK